MLLDDVGLATHQPLTAHREATVATGFVDTGFLQQRQRATAGAEEHEAGLELGQLAGLLVLDADLPSAVIPLVDVVHW